MDDFELELKLDFLEEAAQLLEDCEGAFLELESGIGDRNEQVDKIFRLAHNIKGTSRAVEFGDVAEFTHEMEELILKVKNGSIDISEKVITIFLKCSDHLSNMISTLRENIEATFDSSEVIQLIKSVSNGEEADTFVEEDISSNDNEEIESAFEDLDESQFEEDLSGQDVLDAEELDGLRFENIEKRIEPKIESSIDLGEDTSFVNAAALADLEALLGTQAIKQEELKNAKEVQGITEKDLPEELKEKQPENIIELKPKEVVKEEVKKVESKTPSKNIKPEETIRIGVSRVELLNNYVGELVILQTVLSEYKELLESSNARRSLNHLNKITKEIQDISMRMRMVPLKATLNKMQRIVRDTSKALGKEVSLEIIGEETEVDKTVLEQLGDPLVHIVRNAVDHGLENNSEDRISQGKSAAGNIKIKAFHEGNNLVIEIIDDGKGINPEIIRKIAIEKKVISENDKLTDLEIINLIFAPGFSTKEEVSEISGRGVGMDVVKRNIQNISGVVDVKSEIGKGSVFRIQLPLTMAIIDGMVTQINNEKYVVPLNLVHETIPVEGANFKQVNNVGGCIVLRGQVLPAFRLGKLLKRGDQTEPVKNEIALIVKTEELDFAVLVDDILRQQQVVIKTLGEEIKNSLGFMGSSILGDGKPALILDLKELVTDKIKHMKSKPASVKAA